MKSPTITDVAVCAGVSRSTVSYALSNKRSISDETRERILHVIEELGYKPDPNAIRLATGKKSKNIGVVIPFTRPEIATLEMKFISGAFNVITEADYTFVLIDYSGRNPDKIKRFANSLLVDGFILLEIYQHDDRIEILKKTNIPFVLVGRALDNTGLVLVDQDVHDGMDQIVRYHLSLGHRSIAFIHQNNLEFSFVLNSINGFYAACGQFGITPITKACELSVEDGERAMSELFKVHPEVTGAFIWSDIPTLGVIHEVQSRGMNIPNDFSIICQEHSIISSLPTFAASILDIRAQELTANAARLLIDMIEKRPIPEPQLLLRPKLVVSPREIEFLKEGYMD